jgi:DNA replication protein DnaC
MPRESLKSQNLKAVPPAGRQVEQPPAGAMQVTDEIEQCPVCFGSGMEIIPGKGARPCSCRMSDQRSNPFEKVRVPRRYLGCHFNSYRPDPNQPSQKQAVRFAMQFVQEYPAVDQGLLIMGPVGVGKTHLAVSILKGLTERGGFSCLFYEFGSLLKEIQDSYNSFTQSSELGVLAPILNADVLVLDELGASKPTDWVKDTMAHIINTRYNDRKHTIFTTNYLDQRRGNEEILEERIGVRLRSRLFEMCRTVEIDGKDYRKGIHASGRGV